MRQQVFHWVRAGVISIALLRVNRAAQMQVYYVVCLQVNYVVRSQVYYAVKTSF